ncbi:HI0074 family nucleotidyltransferase substrate-binding subunit [Hippea sp. KM1]|uniref:HI0074 family nucleotidyltransferase substrate-binding subunit n=1 Tax=Hippea sp. KM1 TaxID=944481 RepID=UPI00046CD31D|nr:HI0074 family nucleotidyltransferase substrate-binding subunit [Hippea sp. KM1]
MDLEERKTSFKRAFDRLKEVIENTNKENEDYEVYRDSAIQRFEITTEAFWKCVKVFLKIREGVVCNSPKGCMRELFLNGYVDENDLEILLNMIDDRNLTSHTYNEEVAEEIFQRLGGYVELLKKLGVCW